MKTRLMLAVTFLFMLTLLAGSAQAQSKGKKENAAKKVEATRGSTVYEVPSGDTPKAKPASTRGSSCCIEFSNNTGYWVDVWVDGDYAGRLGPWENDDICVGAGYTKWYAQTAGKTYYWSDSGNCNSSFVQNLNL